MHTWNRTSEMCARLSHTCGAAIFKKLQNKIYFVIYKSFKNHTICVFLAALQVYLRDAGRLQKPILTLYIKNWKIVFDDHFHKWIKWKKVYWLNKSKTAFITSFRSLSKLAEWAKIHLLCYFKKEIYSKKFFLLQFFENCCTIRVA